MPYVRVSILEPKAGHREHVRGLVTNLAEFFSKQPGFIDGYTLDSDTLLGRVTVWEAESDADHAAQSDHVLAVRSQLNQEVLERTHEEHGFQGTSIKPTS